MDEHQTDLSMRRCPYSTMATKLSFRSGGGTNRILGDRSFLEMNIFVGIMEEINKLPQAAFLYSMYHQRTGETSLFHMRGVDFTHFNTCCRSVV